jgi:two-component system NtrC family sensor kinase
MNYALNLQYIKQNYQRFLEMVFKQTGLKYKFIFITIAGIMITILAGSFVLHYLIKLNGGYSAYLLTGISSFYILAGISGILLITKFMIQPVHHLIGTVKEVCQGNLDVHFRKNHHSKRMDEMDRLYEGFDHMVQNLRETIEALTRAKEDAEKALRESFESKTKLEAIFSSISDGIMILDKDYRILKANPVIQKFMGRSSAEINNQLCYEMCNGTMQHCTFCRANVTFSTGEHVTSYCTKRFSGMEQERIFEIHDFPLFNENGEVEQIIEYVKDVTDAVRMQASLESSRRLAEIGEMAAKVAHEVRNPLTAIKGATHYLRAEIADDEMDTYLDLIEEQVGRVNQVATNLLDLSKPLKPVFQPGRLERVVERSLRVTHQQLSHKKIEVIKESEELPEIPLDEHQMEQVLVNLIQNSVDAMSTNGRIRIALKMFPDREAGKERNAVLILSDNGCGIQHQQRDEIFKPFFTTKTKGTGLGLTIVKKIIDLHQGTIEVESKAGEGTDIIVTLPLEPQKHEEQKYYIGY